MGNAGTGPPVSKRARLAAASAMRAMQAVMSQPILDLTLDSPPTHEEDKDGASLLAMNLHSA